MKETLTAGWRRLPAHLARPRGLGFDESNATGLTIDQECRLRIAQELDDIAHPKSLEELEERFKARAG